MASGPITSWQIKGEKVEAVTDFPFLGSKTTEYGNCSHEIRWLLLCRKTITNLDSVLKSEDITLMSQGCGLSSSLIWMWAAAAAAKSLQSCQTLCDPIDGSPLGSSVPGILQARVELGHKEGWVPKNWCFQTVVLEKTLESLLDSKEIKPVSPKGNLPLLLIGRTDAEAEAPILWPPDAKSWLIGKDPDAGEDQRQEEKRTTEDEMVGWHHWLNGHEFGQALEDGEGQGSLACCSPWGCKELDRTWQLNNRAACGGLQPWREDLSKKKKKPKGFRKIQEIKGDTDFLWLYLDVWVKLCLSLLSFWFLNYMIL